MLPLGQINYLKHDLIIYALEIIESAPRPSEFFQMQSYFSNRHRPCMHQQQQNNKTESKLNTRLYYTEVIKWRRSVSLWNVQLNVIGIALRVTFKALNVTLTPE